MCDHFIPLVKKGGRIVNVASVAGHLNGYSADAKKKIQEAASSTSALKDLVSEYEVRHVVDRFGLLLICSLLSERNRKPRLVTRRTRIASARHSWSP